MLFEPVSEMEQQEVVILVVCCTLLLLGGTTANVVSTVTISANTNSSINGNPGAYLTEKFNITTTTTVTATSLTGPVALTVILTAPGYAYTEQVCSSSLNYLDGNTSSSGCTNVQKYATYAELEPNSIRYAMGNAFVMQPGWTEPIIFNDLSSSGQLRVEFGDIINVTESLPASNYELNVYFDAIELEYDNLINEFVVVPEVKYLPYGIFENATNATTSVYYKGPQLSMVVTSSGSNVQSGDTVTYSVTLSHSSVSTETANNVVVSRRDLVI